MLKKIKYLKLISCFLVALGLTGNAYAQNGMTFNKKSHSSSTGTDRVGCSGCDPYNGDTACTTALPILCIKIDGSPNPGVTTNYYNGWAAGHIAHTTPILGTDLNNLSNANNICAIQLGSGYRMAEFHDGNGGWNWYAFGNLRNDTKYWTHINDQANGNCF